MWPKITENYPARRQKIFIEVKKNRLFATVTQALEPTHFMGLGTQPL
jgi:hypothetical protein